MRSKYLESLSEGEYISSLLGMVIRELDLDTDRPVDLDKIPYQEFELEDVEDEETKIQTNTAFVFSQALSHASSLVRCATNGICLIGRAEWFGMGDRVVQGRIQAYVAKHLSSKLIMKELSTIKEAISTSEFKEDNLEIIVNEVTKEIVTIYRVDEGQKTEMIIRLPESYPLSEVEIAGTSRVAVKEERWNRWLLTCKISCKVSSTDFIAGVTGRTGPLSMR